MTPTKAKEISKGRFIFGNPEHLEAVSIIEELERAVETMLRCPHNYELRTKLCACLKNYGSAILAMAAEDPRVNPQWKSSIQKCIKDRP